MATYSLRGVDAQLWARFKSRAALEQIPLRALMLALIEAYGDRTINVKISDQARMPERTKP